MQRGSFEGPKPFLNNHQISIKNRNLFDFAGSIQYFISSIGVPKKFKTQREYSPLQQKKNQVNPSSERETNAATNP